MEKSFNFEIISGKHILDIFKRTSEQKENERFFTVKTNNDKLLTARHFDNTD